MFLVNTVFQRNSNQNRGLQKSGLFTTRVDGNGQRLLGHSLNVTVLPSQGVVGDVGERGPPGPDGIEVRILPCLPLNLAASYMSCNFHLLAHYSTRYVLCLEVSLCPHSVVTLLWS